jgi:hypothetical protein
MSRLLDRAASDVLRRGGRNKGWSRCGKSRIMLRAEWIARPAAHAHTVNSNIHAEVNIAVAQTGIYARPVRYCCSFFGTPHAVMLVFDQPGCGHAD